MSTKVELKTQLKTIETEISILLGKLRTLGESLDKLEDNGNGKVVVLPLRHLSTDSRREAIYYHMAKATNRSYTITEIATLTDISSGGVADALRQLVAQGLVTKLEVCRDKQKLFKIGE